MLEIRPNCECCDKDLAPDATEAMICTYECTFCVTCVNDILENVCPNCSGGFVPRPIRPKIARRPSLSINYQPPSVERGHTKYSIEELRVFSAKVKHIKPKDR